MKKEEEEVVVGKGVLRLQDGGVDEEGVDGEEEEVEGGEDGELQTNPRRGEILLPWISRLQHVQKNPFRGEILSLWKISRARVQKIPKLSPQS